MLQTITNNEETYIQFQIVHHSLIESGLSNGHFGSFKFDKYQWFCVFVVHNGIAAFFHTIDIQLLFNGNPCGGEFFFFDKKTNKMLANPFFGGERYKFPSLGIEDKLFIVLIFYTKIVQRKI